MRVRLTSMDALLDHGRLRRTSSLCFILFFHKWSEWICLEPAQFDREETNKQNSAWENFHSKAVVHVKKKEPGTSSSVHVWVRDKIAPQLQRLSRDHVKQPGCVRALLTESKRPELLSHRSSKSAQVGAKLKLSICDQLST